MDIGSIGGLSQFNPPPPTAYGANMPNVEQRLFSRKAALEAQLADVNAALSALQANPEVLKILCLISKVNY